MEIDNDEKGREFNLGIPVFLCDLVQSVLGCLSQFFGKCHNAGLYAVGMRQDRCPFNTKSIFKFKCELGMKYHIDMVDAFCTL
jgi:hypothetical protein